MEITPMLSAANSVCAPKANNTRYRFLTPLKVDKLEKTTNTTVMEKPAEMLVSLLRSSLNDEPVNMEPFKNASREDWDKLFNLSKESSVTGMALNATDKLPEGTVPKDIIMKMAKIQRESKIRHGEQEKILGELSEMYGKKGIEIIQMKGLGLSMNYPIPTDRFGGDIDIFARLKGTQTEKHSNAYTMIDDMMAEQGIEVEDRFLKNNKHSEFDYKGVRIENHRYFVNKERIPGAEVLDDFLHKSINPHEQILPNGTKILVPSKEFNSVFLAHHAFQHYTSGGIDLHHLTDWSTHIKKNGLQLPEEVKDTPFERFTFALTNLSNRYLGTDVKVPEDKTFEDKIFETLLHPEKNDMPAGLNKAQLLVYKAKRFAGRVKHSHETTGMPIGKYICDAIARKLRKPSELLAYK